MGASRLQAAFLLEEDRRKDKRSNWWGSRGGKQGVSLRGRGRGQWQEELVSLSCKIAGSPMSGERLPQPAASLLGRGGMIQTCEQYQFVHHVMSLYEKQLSLQSSE